MPVHSSSFVPASRASNSSLVSDVAFHAVRMSSRLTKKSLVSVSGRLVKTPCLSRRRWRSRRAGRPRARSFPERSGSAAVPLINSFGGHREPGLEVVLEPFRTGSSTAKDSTSVCSCDASMRPG